MHPSFLDYFDLAHAHPPSGTCPASHSAPACWPTPWSPAGLQVGVLFAPTIALWLLSLAAINCYNIAVNGADVFQGGSGEELGPARGQVYGMWSGAQQRCVRGCWAPRHDALAAPQRLLGDNGCALTTHRPRNSNRTSIPQSHAPTVALHAPGTLMRCPGLHQTLSALLLALYCIMHAPAQALPVLISARPHPLLRPLQP